MGYAYFKKPVMQLATEHHKCWATYEGLNLTLLKRDALFMAAAVEAPTTAVFHCFPQVGVSENGGTRQMVSLFLTINGSYWMIWSYPCFKKHPSMARHFACARPWWDVTVWSCIHINTLDDAPLVLDGTSTNSLIMAGYPPWLTTCFRVLDHREPCFLSASKYSLWPIQYSRIHRSATKHRNGHSYRIALCHAGVSSLAVAEQRPEELPAVLIYPARHVSKWPMMSEPVYLKYMPMGQYWPSIIGENNKQQARTDPFPHE